MMPEDKSQEEDEFWEDNLKIKRCDENARMV